MCTVHIVCTPAKPTNIDENDIVFWWDEHTCDRNEYSVRVWFDKHFLSLRQELVELVYELGQSLVQGQPLYKWFCAGDRLSMWWCSLLFEKHPMLMPELYTILKLRSVEQMLINFAPHCKHIQVHGGDAAFKQCLNDFCLRKNLEYSHKHHTSLLKHCQKILCDNLLFYVFKASFRFVYWLLTVRIFAPKTKAMRKPEPSVTMVTYFPHSSANTEKDKPFFSPYWGPLPTLLVKKNINWLFIRIKSSHMSFRQAILKKKSFQHNKNESFYFLEEFLSLGDMGQAILRYVRICYKSYCLEQRVRPLCHLGQMNVWGYFKPYYAESFQGWRCLERSLQRRAMLAYVAFVGAQEWTLFPLENCPWERMLTEAIKFNNAGKVYGAQHSVLRPTDLRYFDSPRLFTHASTSDFLPHKILVNGQLAYNVMRESGVAEHMLLKIEALRYLHLIKYKSAPVQTCMTRRLMVVTSFFPKAAHAHIRLLAKWLNEKANNQWQVSIKAHPHCGIDDAVKKYMSGIQSFDITDKKMETLLDEAREQNAVIWAAHDTSVTVEAMYAGLRVIIQGAEQGQGQEMNLCPLQGIDGLKYVYTCEDVHMALEKDLSPCVKTQFFELDKKLPLWRALLEV